MKKICLGSIYKMGIKTFETRQNLINKLKSRELQFDDDKMEEVLIKYNYFNLFNGLESLLLTSRDPKKYKGIKLNDFLNIYNFDKELNSIIVNKLNYVEQRLKNSIAYHFTSQYCNSLNDTMQYTNKSNYMNPANSRTCPYSTRYPFVSEQNYAIYHHFNDFILFKPYFLSNLINKNDYIESGFYTDLSYTPPQGVAVYRNSDNVDNFNVAVPFWVAIETLTFGESIRLLHYLKDSTMTEVMKDFGLPLNKRAAFLNMFDFLLCLRNSCAHNFLANRFRTPTMYCVNNLLCTVFRLTPKNTGNRISVLKLYDILKILSFFVDLSDLKIIFRKICLKNIFSLGISKGKHLNYLILNRMGCPKYTSWMKMLSGEIYIL